MMIDKRLIRTVRESKKYIAWNGQQIMLLRFGRKP